MTTYTVSVCKMPRGIGGVDASGSAVPAASDYVQVYSGTDRATAYMYTNMRVAADHDVKVVLS